MRLILIPFDQTNNEQIESSLKNKNQIDTKEKLEDQFNIS